MLGIRTGRRMTVLSPEDAAVHPDIETARSMPSNRIVGDAGYVATEIQALAERTGAVEIMISTMTYGLPERIHTLELVAEHWPA